MRKVTSSRTGPPEGPTLTDERSRLEKIIADMLRSALTWEEEHGRPPDDSKSGKERVGKAKGQGEGVDI